MKIKEITKQIIPRKKEHSLTIGVVICPQCNHEFVKYTDERDLVEKNKEIPFELILKILLSFLVGYVLYKSNMYLLPEDSFDQPTALIYSILIIIPSLILFFSMFAVLYMGLYYIWFWMSISVSALGGIILLGSIFIKIVEAFLS